MNEKWIVQSKAFLGLLLTGLVMFLPQWGIGFDQEAANLVSSTFDQILLVATNLLTLYGILFTTSTKTLLPPEGTPLNPLSKDFAAKIAQ